MGGGISRANLCRNDKAPLVVTPSRERFSMNGGGKCPVLPSHHQLLWTPLKASSKSKHVQPNKDAPLASSHRVLF